MTADVVEGLQLAVEAMRDNHRFVQHRDGDEVPDSRQVLGACNQLPRAPEYALLLRFKDVGFQVVARRNGGSSGEWCLRIQGHGSASVLMHGVSFAPLRLTDHAAGAAAEPRGGIRE